MLPKSQVFENVKKHESAKMLKLGQVGEGGPRRPAAVLLEGRSAPTQPERTRSPEAAQKAGVLPLPSALIRGWSPVCRLVLNGTFVQWLSDGEFYFN